MMFSSKNSLGKRAPRISDVQSIWYLADVSVLHSAYSSFISNFMMSITNYFSGCSKPQIPIELFLPHHLSVLIEMMSPKTGDEMAADNQRVESEGEDVEDGGSEDEPCVIT